MPEILKKVENKTYYNAENIYRQNKVKFEQVRKIQARSKSKHAATHFVVIILHLSDHGIIKTKAFVKGLLASRFTDPPIAYITSVNVM